MKTKLLTIALAVAAIVGGVATTVSADTFDVNPGESIQAAIDSAAPGDIINIAAGTYTGPINVTKTVTLRGAQAGVDARSRTGAETIVLSPAVAKPRTFNITAPGVTIDGLTIDGDSQPGSLGVYAYNTTSENLHVVNNIITAHQTGVDLLGSDSSGLVVKNNLFDGNNTGGANNGVYVGGNGSHGTGITIQDNTFRDTDDGTAGASYAIQFNVIQLVDDVKNIEISGNDSTNDGTFLSLRNVSNAAVSGNTSQQQAETGVMVRDGNVGLTISDNSLKDGLYGVWFMGLAGTTDDVSLTGNTISSMTVAGIMMYADRDVTADDAISASKNIITGNAVGIDNQSNVSIAADNNYWGCEAGPGAAGCDTIDGVVLASSWYTDAALTATNLDEDEIETVPGVPNTSWVNERSGLIVAAIAGLVAVVLGSVAVMRRRSARP